MTPRRLIRRSVDGFARGTVLESVRHDTQDRTVFAAKRYGERPPNIRRIRSDTGLFSEAGCIWKRPALMHSASRGYPRARTAISRVSLRTLT